MYITCGFRRRGNMLCGYCSATHFRRSFISSFSQAGGFAVNENCLFYLNDQPIPDPDDEPSDGGGSGSNSGS